jgi:hypothetical protein
MCRRVSIKLARRQDKPISRPGEEAVTNVYRESDAPLSPAGRKKKKKNPPKKTPQKIAKEARRLRKGEQEVRR